MSAFLQLKGIEKRFGTFTALKGVDLEIDQGEFVCFLGPSGCGKTTLLRIIAGLEAQSAGRIEQAGKDISRLPPSARDYGIVFQSYALFPNLTVADNVGYGLVNRNMPKAQVQQRVEELVRLVGLPGSEAKVPSQLSGGQQQRIALARALATSPGLLLLDEPLSALDAIVRVHLRQEIRSLQRTLGVTTIMDTHDQEEALSVADRIVVMNHGVIEQVGTPEQVYREPASPFVADFVGRVNVLQAAVDGGGGLQVGDAWVLTGEQVTTLTPGSQIQVYLRPEDVLVRPLPTSGSAQEAFEPGASNVLPARIDKIEFLGAYCLARVTSAALGEQGLTTVLSMNFLAEHGLTVGSALAMRLLPERIRCFEP
ncbi:MAG: putative 2-aminoethylphosphonate ABC transporter ATP-binding protein [Rubrivivax sp.]